MTELMRKDLILILVEYSLIEERFIVFSEIKSQIKRKSYNKSKALKFMKLLSHGVIFKGDDS